MMIKLKIELLPIEVISAVVLKTNFNRENGMVYTNFL